MLPFVTLSAACRRSSADNLILMQLSFRVSNFVELIDVDAVTRAGSSEARIEGCSGSAQQKGADHRGRSARWSTRRGRIAVAFARLGIDFLRANLVR